MNTNPSTLQNAASAELMFAKFTATGSELAAIEAELERRSQDSNGGMHVLDGVADRPVETFASYPAGC